MDIFQLIFSYAGLIVQLVSLIVCFYYLSKSKSADSVLLFIGSFTSVLQALFYLIVFPLITRDFDESQFYIELISIITLIGGICFCIGLALLIQKILARTK